MGEQADAWFKHIGVEAKPFPFGQQRESYPVIRYAPLAFAVLLLIACAQEAEKIWYKAGATEDDFNHSSQYCVKYAGVSTQPTKAELARFATCMQNDGWAQVPKPKGTPTQIQ